MKTTLWALLSISLAGCGCDDDAEMGECEKAADCETRLACVDHACVPCTEDAECGEESVCDEGPDGAPGCYDPVVVRGHVFDLADLSAIEGARVVAIDANGAPASNVSVTDATGAYELQVPSARDADGSPLGVDITLRADADGYQTFPGGVRQALPIATGDAAVTGEEDDRDLVVAGELTEIGLNAMPAGSGTASIHGTVAFADDTPYGVLVVADTGGVGQSALADREGAYAIFNLAPGDYSVTGYAQGVSYAPASITLAADQDLEVDLALSDDATGTVSGSVQIVNGGGASDTSVILVVESTFVESLARGDSPPGLRAGNVSGAFTIEGVPAGSYVVLAAFENDFLVRDPDVCISGTDIVYQEVGVGEVVDFADGFKVTGALAVISPGTDQPEPVSATPTFTWEDDSSEEGYDVTVLDSFGEIIWETSTGPSEASVTYGGPALETGRYYQFRASSWRESGGDTCFISRTEDLRGVFFVE